MTTEDRSTSVNFGAHASGDAPEMPFLVLSMQTRLNIVPQELSFGFTILDQEGRK